MSPPLPFVRAVSQGAAARLVAAAAAVAAPVAVCANGAAVRHVSISCDRAGPGSAKERLSRDVRGAASAEAHVHSALTRDVQERRADALEVVCRVKDDPDARVFALRESASPGGRGRRWQLSMRDRQTKDGWILVALPGAMPAITADSARLSYRNANGGRQVDLEVGPSASRLDVWVDYGLDVNIEPDLDPRVDRLNTHGPITALACTIGRAAPE
jgi:hypothetical protein